MKITFRLSALVAFLFATLLAPPGRGQTVTLTGGTYSDDIVVGNDSASVTLQGGSSDEDLTGTVELSAANSYVAITNKSGSDFTLGDIVFDKVQNSDRIAEIDASGTGPVTLTGTYSSPILATGQATGLYGPPSNGGYGASTLQFGGGGNGSANYDLAPTANFSQMEAPDQDGEVNVDGKAGLSLISGNLNIENSTFVAGQYIDIGGDAGANHTVNIIGAQNINLSAYVNIGSGGPWTLGQATADESSFNGGISNYSSTIDLAAVDGGRLDITGNVGGSATGTGITKTGAGTVVLADASGNDIQNSGPLAVDVQQGTLLVENTSQTAFHHATGNIQVDSGATFGGTGTISQAVVATAADSTLVAGDPGQASLGIKPQIGTLSLDNLTATSGLIIDLKLTTDVASNNQVVGDEFLVNNLTLDGPVTIDISSVEPDGSLPTGAPIAVMAGTGNGGVWTAGSNLSFDFELPAGYALNPTFQYGQDGYDFDTDNRFFIFELMAVPEPSTYALFALGLLGLAALRRFRRPNAL